MNSFPKGTVPLEGEHVVASYPYRPFSVLCITNRRLIGRRLVPIGARRFEGEIFWENLTDAEFDPGSFLLRAPSLTLYYNDHEGKSLKSTIRFPGGTATLAGFNPAEAYELIRGRLGGSGRRREGVLNRQ